MTATLAPAPRITQADDRDVVFDLMALGWARPDYVVARPSSPVASGRWTVETVWTDGSVSFSAEFRNVDRADAWVFRLSRVWEARVNSYHVPPFFGQAFLIAADRRAELAAELAEHLAKVDGSGSPGEVFARFGAGTLQDAISRLDRFLGRYLQAF